MSEVLSDKEGGTSVPPEDKDYLRLLGQNEKLRDENGKLWRRLKEHAKTDEHDLSIISALHEAIKARREVAPARLKKLGKGVMKATGILDIGDTHYGEGVSPVSTGGVAEFSREIAKKRFDYTIDEAIRLGKENNVQELWMILGGDMTNGYVIHDELDRINEVMAIQQVLECSEMLYGGMEKLCKAFPDVNVIGISGNHPRLYRKPYHRNRQTENLDYMLYKILEMKGKEQSNLKFHTPETFWKNQEIGGRKMLIMHGDTIKQQNSMGLPWYGLQREFMKWKSMEKDIGGFDDLWLHHFHNAARWNIGDGNIFINASLKGKDDYSISGTRAPAQAGQRFVTVADGEIKGDYLIGLDHIRGSG